MAGAASSARGPLAAVEPALEPASGVEMGLEHPWELTGLYRGVPLTERSARDQPREPDMITLYREPILVEWVETGEDLFRLVRNVIIHEVGHHFGFSDEEIARLEGEGDEATPG